MTSLPLRILKFLGRPPYRLLRRAAYARRGVPVEINQRTYRFALGTQPHLSGDILADFLREQLTLVAHWLRPGDQFLDIGAHYGVFSLVASAAVGPTGRVLAFEPTFETALVLQENLALNGCTNVQGVVAACADRAGLAEFFAQGTAPENSLLRPNAATVTRLVPTVVVDEITCQLGLKPAALKLDVEGAELLVLKGMAETLARDIRIICEMHPYAWEAFGYTEREFHDWLAEHGRQAVDIRGVKSFGNPYNHVTILEKVPAPRAAVVN